MDEPVGMPSVRRRRPTAFDAALVVLAIVSVIADQVLSIDRFRLGPVAYCAFGLAMTLVVAAGCVLLRRGGQRTNGRLLLGIALVLTWSDLMVDYPGFGPFAFLTDVLPHLSDVMVGQFLLRWPRARVRTRAERVAVLVAYFGSWPLWVISDLFYSPRDAGWTAPSWWPTLVANGSLFDALWDVASWVFGAMLVVFVVLIALRFARAARPERRELVPVGVAIGLLVLSGLTEVVVNIAKLPEAVYEAQNLASNFAIATVPVALLTSSAVRRIQRALAIEALTTRGRDTDVHGVVRELRRAMGDRLLDIAIYATESGRYVTADDAPAPEVATGRRALFIPSEDGSPLARLDVTESLAARAELSGPIARAAVGALESARMRAELLSRAADQARARTQLEAASAEGERLSRMLPGGLPEKLRVDPGALGRIDESVVTVVMSDVRGYTTIAENTPPGQLAQQLREHRAAMNAAILAEGGTVMQYVGDAVMAVFGAPFSQPDHAARAVRATVAMHEGQSVVNGAWAAVGWTAFGLGIGVSSGPVATAILGSAERYEYTIVGDTVNLAQRLESIARPAGTTVLSAATIDEIDDATIAVEALPPVHVKGRAETVQAFTIVNRSGVPSGSDTTVILDAPAPR